MPVALIFAVSRDCNSRLLCFAVAVKHHTNSLCDPEQRGPHTGPRQWHGEHCGVLVGQSTAFLRMLHELSQVYLLMLPCVCYAILSCHAVGMSTWQCHSQLHNVPQV